MTTPTDVLCAGIIVADHVSSPIPRLPGAGEVVLADQLLLTIGGCAANVAVDLARQDVAVSVLARVGDDVFGQVVRDMLAAARVDVQGLQTTPGQPTSQTLIVNVASEDRRFIHTIGANGYFRAADIPVEAARRCKVLYLGGFFVMDRMVQDELAPVFAAARSAGAKTILDVVTPGPGDYLPRLDRLLPHVDVFLPNSHEAELMLGEKDPLRQAERLRSLGVQTAIITQGDGGAVLVDDRERLRAGTYAVPFVDGSGGGDAFAAGYIAGLLRDLDPAGCLRYASALGASCVRAIGTTTSVFTRPEAEEFLANNELPIERL